MSTKEDASTPGSEPTLPASASGTPPGSEPTLAAAGRTSLRMIEIGETIDRYRVTKHLGAGGMGIVFAAHDPELKRDVAVKLLREHGVTDASAALQARLMR